MTVEDDGNEDEENEGSQLAGSLLSELSELQGKTGIASAGANDRGLIIGDTVEVIEGDLIGMQGKIMSLDGTTVKVRPNNDAALAELGGIDEVEFLLSQVRKFIAVGAHVKVTDGRYANETGVVVAVVPTSCVAVVRTTTVVVAVAAVVVVVLPHLQVGSQRQTPHRKNRYLEGCPE